MNIPQPKRVLNIDTTFKPSKSDPGGYISFTCTNYNFVETVKQLGQVRPFDKQPNKYVFYPSSTYDFNEVLAYLESANGETSKEPHIKKRVFVEPRDTDSLYVTIDPNDKTLVEKFGTLQKLGYGHNKYILYLDLRYDLQEIADYLKTL